MYYYTSDSVLNLLFAFSKMFGQSTCISGPYARGCEGANASPFLGKLFQIHAVFLQKLNSHP